MQSKKFCCFDIIMSKYWKAYPVLSRMYKSLSFVVCGQDHLTIRTLSLLYSLASRNLFSFYSFLGIVFMVTELS